MADDQAAAPCHAAADGEPQSTGPLSQPKALSILTRGHCNDEPEHDRRTIAIGLLLVSLLGDCSK
jgi:hypothetical protein